MRYRDQFFVHKYKMISLNTAYGIQINKKTVMASHKIMWQIFFNIRELQIKNILLFILEIVKGQVPTGIFNICNIVQINFQNIIFRTAYD